MTRPGKIIIVAVILSAVALAGYLPWRVQILEEERIKDLANQTVKIQKSYHNFSSRAGESRFDSMNTFFEGVSKAHPQLAMIAIRDIKDPTRLLASKNSAAVPGTQLYNKLVEEFDSIIQSGTFPAKGLVRYFTDNTGSSVKFYLFPVPLANDYMLAVFPFTPPYHFFLRIALEALLILLIIIVTATLIYMKRKGTVKDTPLSEKKAAPEPAVSQEEPPITETADKKETSVTIEEERNREKVPEESEEKLNSHVLDLFKRLYSGYEPESIALYLKNEQGSLAKLYELKGRSFLRIDSERFDTIPHTSHLIEELEQGAMLVLENRSEITMPILHDKSLLAALRITRQSGIHGEEMKNLKQEISDLITPLRDYLLVHNVMIDSATGLYSESYLKMRYHELKNKAGGSSRQLGVMRISLFSETPEQKHLTVALKLVAQTLKELLFDDDFLARRGDTLILLTPGTNDTEMQDRAKSLTQTLTRLRIKIPGGEMLYLSPTIKMAGTASSTDPLQELF